MLEPYDKIIAQVKNYAVPKKRLELSLLHKDCGAANSNDYFAPPKITRYTVLQNAKRIGVVSEIWSLFYERHISIPQLQCNCCN